MKIIRETHSPEETRELAHELAKIIQSPALVLLKGEMGAGKTFFVKAFVEATGSESQTGSPTFSIVNRYDSPFGEIYHLDLYRLSDPDEIYAAGIDEILSGDGIKFVEWPEIADIDFEDFKIKIETTGEESRRFTLEGDWPDSLEVSTYGE